MPGLRHGPKLYKLCRNATQRWHLHRTMVTQLVQHERIQYYFLFFFNSLQLEPLMQKLNPSRILPSKHSNQGERHHQSKGIQSISQWVFNNKPYFPQGILTTRFAVKKLVNEIVPKFKEPTENPLKIVRMEKRRKGDGAQMAYIQFNKNELQKYEDAARQEKVPISHYYVYYQYDKGELKSFKAFSKKVLAEERAFFEVRLAQTQNELESLRLQLQDGIQTQQITHQNMEKELKAKELAIMFFQRKLTVVDKDLWIENKHEYDLRRYFRIY